MDVVVDGKQINDTRTVHVIVCPPAALQQATSAGESGMDIVEHLHCPEFSQLFFQVEICSALSFR